MIHLPGREDEPCGAPQFPQNFIVAETRVPQCPQNRGRTGGGDCGGVPPFLAMGGGGGACPAFAARPQESQKRAPSSSTAPQEGQDGAGAGACFREAPVFAPQVPQNFSSGVRGLPQELQVATCAGSASATGCGGAGSPNCEVPQFRQNLAVGATLCPHSAQLGLLDHQSIH